MENDALDFLETDREALETAPDPKPVEAPKVEATPVVAPVEAAPVVEALKVEVKLDPPAPTASADADKEPKTVPLATFLDILNENKELKKGTKPAETPKAEEVQFEIPDPVKNPREYAAYQETMFKFNQMNDRMNFSERLAREKHGDVIIDEVQKWTNQKMETDEGFANRVTNDIDPYSTALKAYNEDRELQEYRAWVAGGKKPEDAPGVVKKPAPELKQLPGSVPKVPVAVPQPAIEAAPTSIADEPSGGKGVHHVPSGPGQAFDSIFN